MYTSRQAKIIIGLPGSGKSTYCSELVYDLLLDDCTPKDLSTIPQDFLGCLVLNSPLFCNTEALDKCIKLLVSLNFQVQCIYFENAPYLAFSNTKNRENKPISLGYMMSLSKNYIIPQGQPIKEIKCK